MCSSDGCTCWFDGSYVDVCNNHDKRYENKRISKWQADKLLFRGVRRKSNTLNAVVMWVGVTLFGWYPYYKATKIKG